MTNKEAMQMALDALDIACRKYGDVGGASTDWGKWDAAMTALRTALAKTNYIGTHTHPITVTKPVAMKFQIYKQTPPRGRELEPINSALLPWVYDQDPSSGNTASMWVTPVATLPPKKEWVGLTENDFAIWREPAIGILRWAEAVLKEKNA